MQLLLSGIRLFERTNYSLGFTADMVSQSCRVAKLVVTVGSVRVFSGVREGSCDDALHNMPVKFELQHVEG